MSTISELNDALRQRAHSDNIVLTRGVAQLPYHVLMKALELLRTYNSFGPENDPYDEHDFGSFHVAGYAFFWKIDYYDLQIKYHSPDPADETQTQRVLTLMLQNEY